MSVRRTPLSLLLALAALVLALALAPAALAAPGASTPDMVEEDDDGDSATDNVTEHPRPRFNVSTDAGANVTIYEGGLALGSAEADATGLAVVGVSPLQWLDPGVHCIYATAVDAAGSAGPESPSLCITVLPGIPPFSGNLGVALGEEELELFFQTTMPAEARIRVLRRGRVVAKTRGTLRAGKRTKVTVRLPRAARSAHRLVVVARLDSRDGRALVLKRTVRR